MSVTELDARLGRNLARAMKARDALSAYCFDGHFEQGSLVEALRDIRHYCSLGCLHLNAALRQSRDDYVGDLNR